ncbi:polyprenol monophosphomannose synthase [Clostridium felsineum]|uniref:polyprenol monophosphomannose synthase n=1 Tax=Clostridium felsineum TaxID=36839 RepID=UPI00214D7453|nr:polyprenol monophosphomannose synthase [Clostridium felsineum]
MLSVIIPIYNEKGNISELVCRIEKILESCEYEIIFVDDSTDDTPIVMKSLIIKHKNIKFKHRINEKGLSSAVISGFEMAKGNIFAVMDGDLQHPPETLKVMLSEINKGAEVVIASRFVKGGNDGGLSKVRKIASFIARVIGKIFLKPLRRVHDSTSGFFMIKREVIDNCNLKAIGWKILIEILVMGKYKKIVEVPYTFEKRNAEKSKLTLYVQFQYLEQIISLLFRRKV